MDITSIQAIVEGSKTMTNLSLSIVAASLLTIFSTSYIKVVGKWGKLIYLLFIPGWIYLALSIQLGDTITRRGIMAAINPQRIAFIVDKINDDYLQQLDYFNTALIFFGTWLFLFLLSWLFGDFISKKES